MSREHKVLAKLYIYLWPEQKKLLFSYIEETSKHHKILVRVIARGVRNGIASAKKAGLYITYAKGSEIVREYPEGTLR